MATRGPIPLHDYLSCAEAAEILGISSMTTWRWMKAGTLQTFIIGGHQFVLRTEVDKIKRERDLETDKAAAGP